MHDNLEVGAELRIAGPRNRFPLADAPNYIFVAGGIGITPILAMIENHRSGLVWNTMKKNEHLRRGLRRAGFTGGWLAQ